MYECPYTQAPGRWETLHFFGGGTGICKAEVPRGMTSHVSAQAREKYAKMKQQAPAPGHGALVLNPPPCWLSSYDWCKISQVVDLTAELARLGIERSAFEDCPLCITRYPWRHCRWRSICPAAAAECT
ncbi:hypothetical protein WJX73_006794 [Symbiochloris irregularis]|uniref:Uncharacterized protein n=1 Tax=Symbiochloris irregularis TaxID=706552 RepID=A0AAW1PPU6_9CHLO